MKKITAAFAAISLVLLSGAVLADNHEPVPLRYVPVEAWTCNYLDGKGPEDLDAVITEWNAFRNLDLDKAKSLMKSPAIVDLRNVYKPEEMSSASIRR